MHVAVIGTGIAGNAAAWTLSKHYPVTVFDREIRPGGHSHTVTIDYDGTPLAVDIGFIVYNELNYPDLTALQAGLGVVELSALAARGNRRKRRRRDLLDERAAGDRREVDFIQRYVFPGGMLPSPQVLKSLGERFGVPVIRERIFGQDYAKTLATWRNNFRAAWPNLMPLGFDDRFRRLWEYYLAYCEAGFLSGNIDVRQIVFAKTK